MGKRGSWSDASCRLIYTPINRAISIIHLLFDNSRRLCDVVSGTRESIHVRVIEARVHTSAELFAYVFPDSDDARVSGQRNNRHVVRSDRRVISLPIGKRGRRVRVLRPGKKGMIAQRDRNYSRTNGVVKLSSSLARTPLSTSTLRIA